MRYFNLFFAVILFLSGCKKEESENKGCFIESMQTSVIGETYSEKYWYNKENQLIRINYGGTNITISYKEHHIETRVSPSTIIISTLDTQGRIIADEINTGVSSSYEYDLNGYMVKQTVNANNNFKTITYTWEGGNLASRLYRYETVISGPELIKYGTEPYQKLSNGETYSLLGVLNQFLMPYYGNEPKNLPIKIEHSSFPISHEIKYEKDINGNIVEVRNGGYTYKLTRKCN